MTLNVLSLPIDIPWKRICVSADMTDGEACDRRFPPRWRSSIAVYTYEPPEEEQYLPGSLVSYVKVTCTVTGYQATGAEVGLAQRPWSWGHANISEYFQQQVGAYYPCYGAILEVIVTAPGDNQGFPGRPGTQPYFADFEPKKREVYETVTESGEVMSRTLAEANIRKGLTTTQTHEVVDSVKAGGKIGGGAGPVSGEVSGEVSSQTRDMTQRQVQDTRTTDEQDEQRATSSHTTQLTQLYHELTGYHAGTNRAVFFLLPRPHMVDSPMTFVKGPRRLEGVQDFLLVMIRPRDMAEVCLEAYLETAHLGISTTSAPATKKSAYFDLELDGFRDLFNSAKNPAVYDVKADPGFELDYDPAVEALAQLKPFPAAESAFKVQPGAEIPPWASYTVTAAPGRVTLKAELIEGNVRLGNMDQRMRVTVEVPLKSIQQATVEQVDKMFLTGRGLCCCPGDRPDVLDPHRASVTWETDLSHVPALAGPAGAGQIRTATVQDANALQASISAQLRQSLNAADRYPRGSVGLAETRLVAEGLARLITTPGHPDNQLTSDIAGLEGAVAARIERVTPGLSRAQLAQMSAQEQADRFGLDEAQVTHLRRAVVGLEGPAAEPAERWAPIQGASLVPDLRGRPFADAAAQLARAGLTVGEVAYEDSSQPRDFVLAQHPEPGQRTGSGVRLTLASGATVRIPELVGEGLGAAACQLRDAGLVSVPEVVVAAGRAGLTVRRVDPEPGTWVTPGGRVTLTVGPSDAPA